MPGLSDTLDKLAHVVENLIAKVGQIGVVKFGAEKIGQGLSALGKVGTGDIRTIDPGTGKSKYDWTKATVAGIGLLSGQSPTGFRQTISQAAQGDPEAIFRLQQHMNKLSQGRPPQAGMGMGQPPPGYGQQAQQIRQNYQGMNREQKEQARAYQEAQDRQRTRLALFGSHSGKTLLQTLGMSPAIVGAMLGDPISMVALAGFKAKQAFQAFRTGDVTHTTEGALASSVYGALTYPHRLAFNKLVAEPIRNLRENAHLQAMVGTFTKARFGLQEYYEGKSSRELGEATFGTAKHAARFVKEDVSEFLNSWWMGGAGKLGGFAAKEGGWAVEKGAEFGEWLTKAIDRLRSFNEKLMETNFRFAEFSGSMAGVQAQQMVRDIEYSQSRGEAQAGSAAYLAEANSRLRRDVQGFEIAWSNMRTSFQGLLTNVFTTVLEKLGVKDLGDWWANLTGGKGEDETNALDQAIEAARKDWESRQRPGRFG